MASSSPSPPTSPASICTDAACVDDQDENSFKCSKCERSVHYRCTKLPAYQIHLINKKRNYSFHCQNCVEVPKSLLELVHDRKVRSQQLQAAKALRMQNIEHEKTIKTLKGNEQQYLSMIEKQQVELSELKKKLQSDPAYHTLEYVEKKLEKKLDQFQEKMLTTIKQECNTAVKSYASVTKFSSDSTNNSTENIKEAVKVARKEEIADNQDKAKRAKNIIIYGVEEPSEDTKRDEEWVKNLIKELRVKINMKRIARIGSPDGEKVRPIIVNLGSEDEKTKLFGNLKALKGLEEYKGVSVCEDLTPTQRKEFKVLADEVKEKNAGGSNITYRVRGSAKNGFFIKKIKQQEQPRQQQQHQKE